MSAYIQIQNVQKSFEGTARQIEALRDVNLEVQAGEFMCLVGPIRLRQVHVGVHCRRSRFAERRRHTSWRRPGA